MKPASLPHSPVSNDIRNPGFIGRLLAAPKALQRLMQDQAASFPAIGLAEGGDVEGAAELFAQTRKNS